MEITRTTRDSRRGPADWFTGEVWLDEIAGAAPPSRLAAFNVHFSPGARTAWHRHPFGQVIQWPRALVGNRERAVRLRWFGPAIPCAFEADEEHWHGDAPNRFMTHLAMQEVEDDGTAAFWGGQVSDAEYLAEPADG
jgi:quercetin dioxygenase-like cupin family protein